MSDHPVLHKFSKANKVLFLVILQFIFGTALGINLLMNFMIPLPQIHLYHHMFYRQLDLIVTNHKFFKIISPKLISGKTPRGNVKHFALYHSGKPEICLKKHNRKWFVSRENHLIATSDCLQIHGTKLGCSGSLR